MGPKYLYEHHKDTYKVHHITGWSHEAAQNVLTLWDKKYTQVSVFTVFAQEDLTTRTLNGVAMPNKA